MIKLDNIVLEEQFASYQRIVTITWWDSSQSPDKLYVSTNLSEEIFYSADEEEIIHILTKIAKQHGGDVLAEQVYQRMSKMIWNDKKNAFLEKAAKAVIEPVDQEIIAIVYYPYKENYTVCWMTKDKAGYSAVIFSPPSGTYGDAAKDFILNSCKKEYQNLIPLLNRWFDEKGVHWLSDSITVENEYENVYSDTFLAKSYLANMIIKVDGKPYVPSWKKPPMDWSIGYPNSAYQIKTPGEKSADSPSTLAEKLPGVDEIVKHPPAADTNKLNVFCDSASRLKNMIMHLNDHHKWTREQIADWVDSLDIDTRFKTAEELEEDRKRKKLDTLSQTVISWAKKVKETEETLKKHTMAWEDAIVEMNQFKESMNEQAG